MNSSTFAIAAVLALGTPFANAQTATASRTDVKAETQKARQAGEIPAGEQGPKERPYTPTQTRDERKAKTLDASAKGEITSRGEATPPEKEPKVASAGAKPRAEVKAETRVANKAGETRVGESFPDKSTK